MRREAVPASYRTASSTGGVSCRNVEFGDSTEYLHLPLLNWSLLGGRAISDVQSSLRKARPFATIRGWAKSDRIPHGIRRGLFLSPCGLVGGTPRSPQQQF